MAITIGPDMRPATFAPGLLLIGVTIMFTSTLFISVAGANGRHVILGLGWILMLTGAARLWRESTAPPGKVLVATLGALTACTMLMMFREHVLSPRDWVFGLILATYFGTGVVAGSTRAQMKMRQGPATLVTALVLLAGAVAWYLATESQSTVLQGRVSGDDSLSPVGVAYVMAVCFTLALVVSLTTNSVRSSVAASLALPLLLLGIIGTGSRGALIGVLAACAVSLMMLLRMQRPLARRLKGLAIVVLGLASVGLLTRDTFLFNNYELLLNRLSVVGLDSSSQERMSLVSEYWGRLPEFWLLGLPGYAGPYPHNLFFEMWLRFGLLGLGMIALTFIACFRLVNQLRKGQSTDVDVLMSALFVLGFMNGQTNLSLEHNRVFWLSLGYLLVRPPRQGATSTPGALVNAKRNVARRPAVHNGAAVVEPRLACPAYRSSVIRTTTTREQP